MVSSLSFPTIPYASKTSGYLELYNEMRMREFFLLILSAHIGDTLK